MLKAQIGTPLYMAPEMYETADYTDAVDAYSFSLIVCEVLAGQSAFPVTLSPVALVKRLLRVAGRRCQSRWIQQFVRSSASEERWEHMGTRRSPPTAAHFGFRFVPAVSINAKDRFSARSDKPFANWSITSFIIVVSSSIFPSVFVCQRRNLGLDWMIPAHGPADGHTIDRGCPSRCHKTRPARQIRVHSTSRDVFHTLHLVRFSFRPRGGAGGALPTAPLHLSTRALWHSQRRLTTVYCSLIFWGSPPTATA
jgi:serine/threonine protein kinase